MEVALKSLVLSLFFVSFFSCSDSNSEEDAITTEAFIYKESKKKDTQGAELTAKYQKSDEGALPVKILKQSDAELIKDDFFISSENPKYQQHTTTYIQGGAKPMVDILLVIDNSGSMYEEQANISTKLEPLLSHLENTEWQINVITTDTPCPKHNGLPLTWEVKENSPQEAAKIYKEATTVGISGSGDEKGIWMAYQHLSGQAKGCSPDWVREGSKFAIVFLTDEDEHKYKDKLYGAEDILSLFETMGKKVGEDAKVYGLISHPDSERCKDTVYDKSEVHADVIAATEGLWGDICLTDYSRVLEDISEDVAFLLSLDIPLKGIPNSNSIQVKVDDAKFMKWSVDKDVFTLKEPLEPGSKMIITYQLQVASAIPLPAEVKAPHLVKVYFGPDYVEPDQYYYLKDHHTLNFVKPLPLDTTIYIEYPDLDDLRQVFPFPEVSAGSNIACYLDGTTKVDHFYDVINSEIRFVEVIPPASTVHCIYF